jgi:hypothetical protein
VSYEITVVHEIFNTETAEVTEKLLSGASTVTVSDPAVPRVAR